MNSDKILKRKNLLIFFVVSIVFLGGLNFLFFEKNQKEVSYTSSTASKSSSPTEDILLYTNEPTNKKKINSLDDEAILKFIKTSDLTIYDLLKEKVDCSENIPVGDGLIAGFPEYPYNDADGMKSLINLYYTPGCAPYLENYGTHEGDFIIKMPEYTLDSVVNTDTILSILERKVVSDTEMVVLVLAESEDSDYTKYTHRIYAASLKLEDNRLKYTKNNLSSYESPFFSYAEVNIDDVIKGFKADLWNMTKKNAKKIIKELENLFEISKENYYAPEDTLDSIKENLNDYDFKSKHSATVSYDSFINLFKKVSEEVNLYE